MAADEHFDLERFVTAQDPVFSCALKDLEVGRKRGHWMWFIFPQLRGLGRSSTAEFYGIGCLEEARAYLAHPVLGSRLTLCTKAVLAVEGRPVTAIFGSPDDMKFRSSMTLFAIAAGEGESVFTKAVERYHGGRGDDRTLALLAAGPNPG